MLRAFKHIAPKVDASAYIDESAQVIGDVEIGKNSSVWFNAVVRGDVYYIRIGENTNIQDASVLHVTRDRHATLVGDYVTVGHGVILHGCTIDAHCLIGMGAIILDRVKVGQGSIVGAGALVTQGLEIPPGSLVIGSPAKVARPLTPEEIKGIDHYAENYLMYKENYLKS